MEKKTRIMYQYQNRNAQLCYLNKIRNLESVNNMASNGNDAHNRTTYSKDWISKTR